MPMVCVAYGLHPYEFSTMSCNVFIGTCSLSQWCQCCSNAKCSSQHSLPCASRFRLHGTSRWTALPVTHLPHHLEQCHHLYRASRFRSSSKVAMTSGRTSSLPRCHLHSLCECMTLLQQQMLPAVCWNGIVPKGLVEMRRPELYNIVGVLHH